MLIGAISERLLLYRFCLFRAFVVAIPVNYSQFSNFDPFAGRPLSSVSPCKLAALCQTFEFGLFRGERSSLADIWRFLDRFRYFRAFFATNPGRSFNFSNILMSYPLPYFIMIFPSWSDPLQRIHLLSEGSTAQPVHNANDMLFSVRYSVLFAFVSNCINGPRP